MLRFLALAMLENITAMVEKDKNLAEPADHGSRYATMYGVYPSAAWA